MALTATTPFRPFRAKSGTPPGGFHELPYVAPRNGGWGSGTDPGHYVRPHPMPDPTNPTADPNAPNANPDGNPSLPPGVEGGQIGEGGVAFPFYNPNYPDFTHVQFPTIDPAYFKFTDPIEYARQFGEFNRGEVRKNFNLGKDFALEALGNELQGLKAFAPGAAALKREQISIDNQFNQSQRQAQVNAALPEARGDLAAQRRRAMAYAEGRLPDEQLNTALELGIRSNAADRAGFSGFGAKSAQASKISDLMSAEERFGIAQYGEGLVGQNLQTKAGLFLAPTEYSNAGSEIRSTPEVGAGRLTYQGAGMINEATLVSPAQALTSTIQQEQFKTQLEQRTNEFNATGTFDASKFNSVGQFEADLGKFGYDTSYLGAVQAARQAQLNNANALEVAGVNNTNANAGVTTGQSGQNLTSSISGIGAIGQAANVVQDVLSGWGLVAPRQPQTTAPAPAPEAAPSGGTVGGTKALEVGPAPQAVSFDASAPGAMKFAQGSPVPAGYSPIATNSDGTYSAIRNSTYDTDRQSFARSNGIPSNSIDPALFASVDKSLSSAAALSYVPIPGMRQVALASNGRQVYSLPAAADSNNVGLGPTNIANLAATLAHFGVATPEIFATLGNAAGALSDPGFYTQLDKLHNEKGAEAVAQAVKNRLGDNADLSTPEGQMSAFTAQRIGELWGGLSPYQKSMALTTMLKPSLGNISNKPIPGTEKSIVGKLTTGDVNNFTAKGINGFGVARNWNQLSTIGNIVTKGKNKEQIAKVVQQTGLVGFGPQGAAVPVEDQYLKKVGARAIPEMGVGATVFSHPNLVPGNYKVISQTPQGNTVAMPANLVSTAAGALSPTGYSKIKDIAANKHPAQKLWARTGSSPARAIRGANGGSAIISGLNVMRDANPNLLGSIIAYSLLQGTAENPVLRLNPGQAKQLSDRLNLSRAVPV